MKNHIKKCYASFIFVVPEDNEIQIPIIKIGNQDSENGEGSSLKKTKVIYKSLDSFAFKTTETEN